MRPALLLIVLLAITGCGTRSPDLAAVEGSMTAEQGEIGEPISNRIGMILVPIPAGEFRMGTKIEKGKPKFHGAETETPQHRVTLTRAFYLGSFEVTQQQYQEVMGETPWADQPLVREGPNHAASYVSWDNAVEFCKRLSALENEIYRLPTEAEWEYACRAGTMTPWSFDVEQDKLVDYVWHDANAYKDGRQYAQPVGQKLPNAWGLHDMHGNVWEWCSDWYAPYSKRSKEETDPTGPKKGSHRVWRGGSFADAAISTRSATRLSFGRVGYRPEHAAGFRVVREVAIGK